MNSKKIAILIILMASFAQIAQSKGYVIPANIYYLDASSSAYSLVKGGDTLYFSAGNRTYLMIKNFRGDASNPIVMINQGGDVIIDTDHYYGISVQNCRYIKLTGTGYKGMMYGFKIKRVANGAGLSLGALSSDFEVDHISIENTLIGGLYAKTDPDCTPATDRANFTQYNTIIHDNYVARTGDEGMYIGSTKFDGQTVTCNGTATLLYPSLLDGVKVYNNIVEYTGWDGIQVSSASRNCQIFNNTVRFDSQAGHDTQMSGIILGGGTKADCFNNYIADGKGVGIECHGLGGTRIFNNIIVNPGLTYYPGNTSWPKHGIYISDNSVQKDSSFYIFNNTIVNPKSDGIRFSSIKSRGNLISSNVIINPGNFNFYETDNTSFTGLDSYVMIQLTGTDVTLKNNYFQRTGSLVGFQSQNMHDAGDFALVAGSPLIDAADTNPKVTATFDYLKNPRPRGVKSDIGAYEYNGEPTTLSGGTIAADQNLCPGSICAPLTNVTAPVGLTGTIEYKWQSSTTSGTSGFIDIQSSNTGSYAPGSLSSTTWYRRLARVAGSADWANAGLSNVVTVTVNPLPAAEAGADRSVVLNTSTQIGAPAVTTSKYSWTSLPAGFTSAEANPTVAPSEKTTYTVVETCTYTGCINSHSVVVTINTLPAAATGSDQTICQNEIAQIGAAPVPGSTYSWISSPAGFTSSAANPTVAPQVTTTYTLTETISASGSVNTNSVKITVNPLPAVAAIGGTNSVCQGSTTLLTNSTAGGIWSSSDPYTASVSSSGVVSGLNPGNVEIRYTVTSPGGCSASAGKTVTVNGPAPQPGDFTQYSSSVKPGQQNVTYTVPYVPGETYLWSYSGKGVTIRGTTNSVVLNFSKKATPGTLSVIAMNGCGSSVPRSIAINLLKDAVLTESLIPGIIDLPELKNSLNIYPNPGNGQATFEFQVSEDAKVSVDVYTMTGQRIASIFNENVPGGTVQTVHFDRPLTIGVYPCVMRWKGELITMKLIVNK